MHSQPSWERHAADTMRVSSPGRAAAPRSRDPLSKLGWDALEELPPLEAFGVQLAARRNAKLKPLLLDQVCALVCG